ncbi:MAG: hypothetical protein ACO3LE_07465 [Bdellovibrionota bacterium]
MKSSAKNQTFQTQQTTSKKIAGYQVNLNATRILQFKLAEAQKRIQSSGIFS